MRQLKTLYIIGAGGFGREVAWLVERINRQSAEWDFKGFLDDDEKLWNTDLAGYRVYGGYPYIQKLNTDTWIVMAVGKANVRARGISRLAHLEHVHYATLIDPTVQMSGRIAVGEGTIICAGTLITVDVSIGRHNIINLDCTIGHDAVLEDFVTLYPSVNISGTVRIGTETELGTGSQVIQGIHIGNNTIVGAGATVIRDIESNVTAIGTPARVIKSHAPGGANNREEHKYYYIKQSEQYTKVQVAFFRGGSSRTCYGRAA
jgi:sugar O-acyltransferase (sialic acid O-acetyltransferase NeuD family)